MNTIILASGSRYRRELLGRLGLDFAVHAPDIDEAALPGEKPRDTAVRLARAKAEAIAARFPASVVIGSDQVAELDGAPLGKPGTRENARAQLHRLSAQAARFHTALCVIGSAGRRHERVVTTEVVFRKLSDAEIERYLAREDVLDCAGSAKSEGLGVALLARMTGDDPTALVGLPLIALCDALRAEGFEIP